MQRKGNVPPAAHGDVLWQLPWGGITGRLGGSDVKEMGWLGRGAHWWELRLSPCFIVVLPAKQLKWQW